MKKQSVLIPESWGLVVSSFAAAYGVGLLALLALPYLISAIMNDLGLDAAQAGMLMSAEFVVTMVASLGVASVVGRAPRRTLALIGALLVVTANLISAQVGELHALVIVRCLAGFGAGICLSCGNASIAAARDPERAAGQMNVLFVALMAAVMIVYADVMGSYGLKGLYLAIAATNALMLGLIVLMPQRRGARDECETLQANNTSGRTLLSMPAIFMMAAMFLFSMRDTMGWAFVEQVGVRVGYSGDELGRLFALQSVLGLIGPVLASLVGRRFGIAMPVIFGIVSTGMVGMGYVLGEHSRLTYTVSVMLISTTYFYALAYLTGLAASLDRDGRIAAASGSFLTLGIAVGPTFSGLLAEHGGFPTVGWGIGLAMLATLIAVAVPLGVSRRRAYPSSRLVATS
ncbi:MFS transporter [Pseudomonas sp. CES]|uniref:MFS transporter n=1 Tax=Pseudomonas sp. CES TaxID=2719586 RepID=UPI0014708234|nr:MFS transporter [Pseudomonas sp. CES]KAF4559681.1 MFS transporter [Pseudomonas sp. CES]